MAHEGKNKFKAGVDDKKSTSAFFILSKGEIMDCHVCHNQFHKITRFWREKIYHFCSEKCASIHLQVISELISKEKSGEINEN